MQKMNRGATVLLSVAGLMVAGLATGCNVGGGGYAGGGGGYGGGPIDPYRQAWYDVYGNHCLDGQPRSGCNFYYDGTKIRDYQDPFYTSGHLLTYSTWTYTDSYGFRQSYIGYGWLSTTGILYNDFGRALNEADSDAGNVDVIGDVARAEAETVKVAGQAFANKWNLAEDKALKIATTLNSWATISRNKRARTQADMADVAKNLYGINTADASVALAAAQNGNTAGLDKLNNDIATYWGTSPETSKEILKKWYSNFLGQMNVK